jgi:hypothetical protein
MNLQKPMGTWNQRVCLTTTPGCMHCVYYLSYTRDLVPAKVWVKNERN